MIVVEGFLVAAYCQQNKEHIRNYRRQYCKNNREQINEYWRRYYALVFFAFGHEVFA